MRTPGRGAALAAASLLLYVSLVSALAPLDFHDAVVKEAVDLAAAQEQMGEDHQGMEDLLHFAISHSDPAILRERAEAAQRDQVIQEYKEQRKRVKELADHLAAQPTEVDLMTGHLAVLRDPHADEAAQLTALAELRVLVEPIDRANDLKAIEGIAPLVALLEGPPAVAEAAAWVVGTAASNNAKFQEHLLAQAPGVVPTLLKVSASPAEGTSLKGLYALGQLLRISPQARGTFYSHNGLRRLRALMEADGASVRLQRKAMGLLTDLMDLSLGAYLHGGDDAEVGGDSAAAAAAAAADESGGGSPHGVPVEHRAQFVGAALQLLSGAEDLDGREKALLALRSLLVGGGAAARDALADEGAEAVLREVLTELERLHDAWSEAGGGGGGKDAGEDGGGGQGAGPMQRQYLQYVIALTADLLHHLEIDHAEL